MLNNKCSDTAPPKLSYTHSESKGEQREFPGGPVVRTPSFHCRGARVQSLVREPRSRMPHGVAKKKKKNGEQSSGCYRLRETRV